MSRAIVPLFSNLLRKSQFQSRHTKIVSKLYKYFASSFWPRSREYFFPSPFSSFPQKGEVIFSGLGSSRCEEIEVKFLSSVHASNFQWHIDNLDLLVRLIVFWICLYGTYGLCNIHSFDHTAEYSVLVIQPWLSWKDKSWLVALNASLRSRDTRDWTRKIPYWWCSPT